MYRESIQFLDNLFLATFPSPTILTSILILVFNKLKALTTKEDPILWFIESTTIKNFFELITPKTVLRSDPHSFNLVSFESYTYTVL